MTKKRIKILTHGPIRVKSFINGPVLTPYYEDISTIFAMISQGVHVVEVCDDRTEIRLTTNNITEDNSKAAREERENLLNNKHMPKDTKEEVVEAPEVVEETKVEAVKETEHEVENSVINDIEVVDGTVESDTKEEVVEETKVEDVTKTEAPKYEKQYNNHYNNNKHNKHNKR